MKEASESVTGIPRVRSVDKSQKTHDFEDEGSSRYRSIQEILGEKFEYERVLHLSRRTSYVQRSS